MNGQINETLIRDIISEVLGRLGPNSVPQPAAPFPVSAPACGCGQKSSGNGSSASRGKYGVFQDANEACEAARGAYLQLQQKGVAARAKIVEIVKQMCDANAAEWGRLELA